MPDHPPFLAINYLDNFPLAILAGAGIFDNKLDFFAVKRSTEIARRYIYFSAFIIGNYEAVPRTSHDQLPLNKPLFRLCD